MLNETEEEENGGKRRNGDKVVGVDNVELCIRVGFLSMDNVELFLMALFYCVGDFLSDFSSR